MWWIFCFWYQTKSALKKKVVYGYPLIKDTYLVDGIDNTDTSRSELKISKKRKATSFGDANVLSLLQQLRCRFGEIQNRGYDEQMGFVRD
jgi:hypothetical protein